MQVIHEDPWGLTPKTLTQGVEHLSQQDPDLAQVVRGLGVPPMWVREPGFATLIHIILEQQVSLTSAQAAFNRLLNATGTLTPQRFLSLDDASLKTVGFSRQKTAYGRYLAEAIVDGRLNLEQLATKDDAAVQAELLHIKGIGPWTANIYLLMALRRPDVWPAGDLALAIAVQQVKRLASRPSPDELQKIASAWRPWRAVAARILWHYYLS